MKINTVKFILAMAISILLGFICEILAPETDGKNWISFGIAFATIAAAVIPAMGLNYKNDRRAVSIKTFSWLLSIVLMISNIVFSCFDYQIDVYIAINCLIAVIGWVIIYGLFSAKTA
jgi:hypothetical protein